MQLPGGMYEFAPGMSVTRMGLGAMQLAGPNIFGPPKDHDQAIRVLRDAVDLGITHLDTADFYGPHIVNRLIREALYPYPEGLHVVTKIGSVRDTSGRWVQNLSAQSLRANVEDNLRNLNVDVLDVVNLRVGDVNGPPTGSIAEPFEVLAALQQEGLIRHLGVSTVTAEQVREVQAIAPIVCVQNEYNIISRNDDHLLDTLASQGIAYVPYFPLGGLNPVQADILAATAADLGTSIRGVALAWLLRRAPNILLIPGTSKLAHLRSNITDASVVISSEQMAQLDTISRL